MSKTLLDEIEMATPGATDPRIRTMVDPTVATSTLVPGETDTNTYAALATMYDMRRDKALEGLAKLCADYGAAMEKREIDAVFAAPLVAEMRKALERAEGAQVRALAHRNAASKAR